MLLIMCFHIKMNLLDGVNAEAEAHMESAKHSDQELANLQAWADAAGLDATITKKRTFKAAAKHVAGGGRAGSLVGMVNGLARRVAGSFNRCEYFVEIDGQKQVVDEETLDAWQDAAKRSKASEFFADSDEGKAARSEVVAKVMLENGLPGSEKTYAEHVLVAQ